MQCYGDVLSGLPTDIVTDLEDGTLQVRRTLPSTVYPYTVMYSYVIEAGTRIIRSGPLEVAQSWQFVDMAIINEKLMPQLAEEETDTHER